MKQKVEKSFLFYSTFSEQCFSILPASFLPILLAYITFIQVQNSCCEDTTPPPPTYVIKNASMLPREAEFEEKENICVMPMGVYGTQGHEETRNTAWGWSLSQTAETQRRADDESLLQLEHLCQH